MRVSDLYGNMQFPNPTTQDTTKPKIDDTNKKEVQAQATGKGMGMGYGSLAIIGMIGVLIGMKYGLEKV